MTTEFDFLGDCLDKHLSKEYGAKILAGKHLEFNIYVQESVNLAIAIIRRRVYDLKLDEQAITNYISLLQLVLTEMDDDLFKMHRPFPKLNFIIAQLLNFLILEYKKFFNFSGRVPNCIRYTNLYFNEEIIANVLTQLEKSKTDHALRYILSQYIKQETNVIGSFREMEYYINLVCSIEELLLSYPVNEIEAKLWELLIYYNFNTRQFATYVVVAVRKRFADIHNWKALELNIANFMRLINQSLDHPDHMFDPHNTSVKVWLIHILTFEKEYLAVLNAPDHLRINMIQRFLRFMLVF